MQCKRLAMSGKERAECWLLEYACRFGQSKVIEAIGDRHHGDLHTLGVSPIRLAQVALSAIVDNERLEDFDAAVELVDQIYQSTEKLVSFKHYAKLISSLKIKSLFHMLTTGDRNVLAKLNQYFPRAGIQCHSANKRTLMKLHASQSQFRKFFLPLLANENQRKAYLEDEYCEEFGEDFMHTVKMLTQNFLDAIDANLPPTILEKLMETLRDSDIDTHTDETGEESVAMEIVLESLQGKQQLTCQNMLEILTMLSPRNTQDRVLTEHTISLSTLPDSDSFTAGHNQDLSACESHLDIGASFLDFQPSVQKQDSLSSKVKHKGFESLPLKKLKKEHKEHEERNNNDLLQNELETSKQAMSHDIATSAENWQTSKRKGGQTKVQVSVEVCPDETAKSHNDQSPVHLQELTEKSCDQTEVASPDSHSPSLLQNSRRKLSEETRIGDVGRETEHAKRGEELENIADQVHAITSSSDGMQKMTEEKEDSPNSALPQQDLADNECTDIKMEQEDHDECMVSKFPGLQSVGSKSSPAKKRESIMDTSDVEIIMVSSSDDDDLDNLSTMYMQVKMSNSMESVSDIDKSSEPDEEADQDVHVPSSQLEDQMSQSGPHSVQTVLSDTLTDTEEEEQTLRKMHSNLISPFRKSSHVKLCLVKLFRNEKLDMRDERSGTLRQLYS